jgi:glyoxylase-like metal-dependent hydrolase (beta-lactamase superfamily II)
VYFVAAQLTTVADGVHVGPLFPRNVFNTVVLEGPQGDVLVDAGPPWSGRRLARFLRGRDVVEHVVTHAHGDHVGSTAWVCEYTGAPLAMSEIEADDFESGGSIAYHAGAAGKYLVAPLGRRRRSVDRRLKEGDAVAGFEVLAQPGHSPGLLAFWREADRTLVVGDGPINLSKDPSNPRWLHMPKKLHCDPDAAVASRWRLSELRPELIVSTHGYPVRGADRWIDGVRSVVH